MRIGRLFLLSFTLFLAACSGGSGDPLTSITLESYNITSFDVVGTSADIAPDIAPISPAIDMGDFTISWELSDPTEAYLTRLYYSDDDSISAGDIEFYEFQCLNTHPTCTNIMFNDDCNFSNSNIISCDEDPSGASDLTTELAALPQNGYILLQSCDFLGFNCAPIAAHAIQLQ